MKLTPIQNVLLMETAGHVMALTATLLGHTQTEEVRAVMEAFPKPRDFVPNGHEPDLADVALFWKACLNHALKKMEAP